MSARVNIRPVFAILLAAGLTSCTVSTSSHKPAEDPGSDSPASTGGSEKPSGHAVSAESKAWFEKCSAHYDSFMAEWKSVDEEARTVISETKEAPYYTAASKLTAQLTKTCVAAKQGKWKMKRMADDRGTGLALRLALAKAQARNKKGAFRLFTDAMEGDMVRNLPSTGDDFFDRNAFCLNVQMNNMSLPEGSSERYFMALDGQPHNSVHWLSDADREKFNAKYKELTDDAAETLRELAKQFVPTTGEYGRVKGVKKEADGSLVITAKRVEVPYDCQHTGNYHWDGVAFNDCSYVDRPAVEVYGFTAHLADAPPSDVKAGDFIYFAGTAGGKVPNNNEMANAKWEVLALSSIFRNKKPAFEIARVEQCN
jgi:hypothetical protein